MQALYPTVLFCLLSCINCLIVAPSSVGLEDTLHKILESLEELKNQVNTLQLTCDNKTSPITNGCAIGDITDAIKSRNYELAEAQILELKNKKKIAQIVHIVYAGKSANMDIILDFAKKLSDNEIKFQVFSALHDEMRLTGSSDPFKLFSLVEAMERAMGQQKNFKAELRAKAKAIVDNAIESVKDSCVTIFKTAMMTDKYKQNAEIEALATAIFNYRTDLSDGIIERVVDSAFGVVAAKKILSSISSHKYIPQVIAGLVAVFHRFNYANNLNNDAILDLASHLRDLQLRSDYANVDQELKTTVDEIIERLPSCARSLYFYKDICLWNKAKSAYMYAASAEYVFDKERRNLFTWHADNIVNGAVWHVEQIGDYYFFKNAHHANEYMYSLNGDPIYKEFRNVFTWIPGFNTDEQSRWIIELDGNYCYLKSAYSNEYLIASSVSYNKFNDFVFTWVSPTINRGEEFQWELRNCGRGGK